MQAAYRGEAMLCTNESHEADDEGEAVERPNEPALLSEAALSDWDREAEDAAWAHLQAPES
jgi:hypothetical protein